MRRLGSISPDTAIMSSTLEIFLVELGKGPRRDEPEPSEAFGKIHRLTYQELRKKILKGDVRDGYTIAALSFAQLNGLVRSANAR